MELKEKKYNMKHGVRKKILRWKKSKSISLI